MRAEAYCHRCKRGFKSEYAIDAHRRDSRRHWECPTCGFDADGWDALLDHCRDTDCRSVCQGCDDGTGEHWRFNSSRFWQHVDDCNVCTACEEHFHTPYDLKQHNTYYHGHAKSRGYEDEGYDTESYEEESSDDESDVEGCLKCERDFTTYGGMILHLESGCCSNVNCVDLNQLAVQCRRSNEFVYTNYRYAMFGRYDIDYVFGNVDLYFCPACDASVSRLSALFQHVESSSCDQNLDEGAIGTLQRHLEAYL